MKVAGRVSRRLAIAASAVLIILGCHVGAMGAQLTLAWVDTADNELGFAIERSLGTAGTFAEIGATGEGVTEYVDDTVFDASTYCYRIRAYNAEAYSPYSSTVCATTGEPIGLAVVKAGTGGGTVIANPPGIVCGATCSGGYDRGAVVKLTAAAAPGSTFTGWSGGGCTGTGRCAVALTAATVVTANFTRQDASLRVVKVGGGSGTVTSGAPGIDCGSTCRESYPIGVTVTLTAAAEEGSTFLGWNGGGCAGTGPCTVTLAASTRVSAIIARAAARRQ